MSSTLSTVILVSNLPPDATDDEMKQLCSRVGEVVRFTVIYDKETQQPRGHGVCEYRDPKLVDAAVQLLNGFEHRGANLIVRRVNHSKQSHHSNQSQHYHKHSSSHHNQTQTHQKKKKRNSSKVKAIDEISRVIATYSTSDKRAILSEIKHLIEANEKMAKELLEDNPQLAEALLLIEMEFNLVKPQDIDALTHFVPNEVSMPQNQRKVRQMHPTMDENRNHNIHHKLNTHSMIRQQEDSVQHTDNVMDVDRGHQMKGNDSDDKKVKARTNPPSKETSVTSSEGKLEEQLRGMSEEQQKVIRNVMKLTPEAIAKLPPHVQKQIRSVQAEMAKRGIQSKSQSQTPQ